MLRFKRYSSSAKSLLKPSVFATCSFIESDVSSAVDTAMYDVVKAPHIVMMAMNYIPAQYSNAKTSTSQKCMLLVILTFNEYITKFYFDENIMIRTNSMTTLDLPDMTNLIYRGQYANG